ncbi:MAG: DUF2275 domain-containing protein [Lachnospiraceae bacterium]
MEQYRMDPKKMNSGTLPKPENRFTRIWGPLFIKWGISLVVSFVAVVIFEMIVLMRESGMDIATMQDTAKLQEIMQQYMSSTSATMEFSNEIMQEFMKYSTPVEGVAALITIPIMLFMFHKDRVKEKLSGFVPNKKASLVKYGLVLIMMAAITIGVNNLMQIGGLMDASEEYEQTMSGLYSASIPMQLLCLGFLVPVCEELVFRGLMFRRIRQANSFLKAALYTSLVFGFLHMNMVQMIYGFLLGMIFCYLYEKYGSVKAPVFAHMTANIVAVFMTYFHALDWMAEDPMRIGVITIICASVASSMYVLIQRIDEKPEQIEQENPV